MSDPVLDAEETAVRTDGSLPTGSQCIRVSLAWNRVAWGGGATGMSPPRDP